MALTEIEYGSVARSTVLNDNFDYLDKRIDTVGASITTVQSNLATLNTTLNNKIDSNNSTINSTTVKLTGNQTISGIKTFSSSPLVPTASTSDNSTKAASTAFVKNCLAGANSMPNYSTAQNNKAADTWHSATVNGWLHLQTGSIDDRNDPYLQIKYNGVTRTFRSSGSTTSSEHFYYCIVAPCPKGATYYMYAGNSGATLSFIPSIGG